MLVSMCMRGRLGFAVGGGERVGVGRMEGTLPTPNSVHRLLSGGEVRGNIHPTSPPHYIPDNHSLPRICS